MSIRKMTLSAILIGIGVAFATFMVFPNAYPVQHFVNMVSAVVLGPWYAVANAFIISLLRNILGLGTLKAFPGSMIGALFCGILYQKFQNKLAALVGEVFGTGVLGAIASYPVVLLLVGNKDVVLLTFVPSFVLSSIAGGVVGYILLVALEKTGTLDKFKKLK